MVQSEAIRLDEDVVSKFKAQGVDDERAGGVLGCKLEHVCLVEAKERHLGSDGALRGLWGWWRPGRR